MRPIRLPKMLPAHLAGLGLAVIVGWPLALLFYDQVVPVVVVRSQASIEEKVPAGGNFHVVVRLKRLRSCPVIVYQWIFDSRDVQYALMPFAVEARPLGADRVTLEVPVPQQASPGPARYQLAWTHTCDFGGLFKTRHSVSRPYLAFVIE